MAADDRLVLALLPISGMAAGAAPGIVGAIVDQKFLAAAPMFAVLLFGVLLSLGEMRKGELTNTYAVPNRRFGAGHGCGR